MRKFGGLATAALALGLVPTGPAKAQESPYALMERALDLVLDNRREAAMALARQAAAACAMPDAPANDCVHAMAMASQLARQAGEEALAEQWAAMSTTAATRHAGADSLSEAAALSAQAGRLRELYRFSEAIATSERALAVFERERGSDNPYTDGVRAELAEAFLQQGRLDEAEFHLRTVLEHTRARSGENAITTGLALNSLGRVNYLQGRLALAEQTYRQAMAILGDDSPVQSIGFHSAQLNLGATLLAQGRVTDAEPLIRAALDSGQLEIDRAAVFAATDMLARVLLDGGRAGEAQALGRRNLARAQQRDGALPASVARYTVTLARAVAAGGDLAEADALYTRAIAVLQQTLGPEHPTTIEALHGQARLRRRIPGSSASAAGLLEQAADGVVAAASRASINPQRAAALREHEALFTDYLDVLYEAVDPARDETAFAMMQWAMTTDAALTLSRVAAQRAIRADEVGVLEAQQAQLAADRTAAAAAYDRLLLEGGDSADERPALAAHMAELTTQMEALNRRIAEADPAYHTLSRVRVAALASVQQALLPDEAVLLVKATPGGTHLMLVRAGSFTWHHAADLTDLAVAQQVGDLRQAVQESLLYEDVAYPEAAARALQQALFAALEPDLAGIARLHIATDGRLATLPFALLPDAASPSGWLADRFALTNLPSLVALVTNRAATGATGATERAQGGMRAPTLAGIGAPALAGPAGAQGGALPGYDAAFAPPAARGGNAPARPLADPQFLTRLAPLPGAAAELQRIGALFPQGAATLWLGAEAIEPSVRADAAVAEADLLVFATHGLLATESLAGEPGLVLTPPTAAAGPSGEDDGFLGASEVAQMQLAARLILLSACNTGTPGGRGAAGGLSALARSFLTAGQGQVLASHWPVSDEATAVLMTEFIRAWQADPERPAGQHLAQAMAHVRAQPDWQSPGFWAALTIYDDGGV